MILVFVSSTPSPLVLCRREDSLRAFNDMRLKAVGLCTDDILLPALLYLQRYGDAEGINVGLNLLVHGCGLPPSLPMSIAALCFTHADPIFPEGKSVSWASSSCMCKLTALPNGSPYHYCPADCEQRVYEDMGEAMVKSKWFDRGAFSGSIVSPTDGRAMWTTVHRLRSQAPLAASLLSVSIHVCNDT